jgi:acid phosphatase
MENHGNSQILGNRAAPFLNGLIQSQLRLTNSFAVTHPSEPNYLALFSGSTMGLTSDACPVDLSGPNLASELSAHGLSFAGYSEGLPAIGYTGCTAGEYARKHNPWVDFANVPAAENRPFSSFPTNYNLLPTVSFVVPNLLHDMHDGTIAEGDAWLHIHLQAFATWAITHNSLLIITWDEAEAGATNQIPTIIAGARLMPGTDDSHTTHYNVLRTIEAAYGLAALGSSATAAPLTADWQP